MLRFCLGLWNGPHRALREKRLSSFLAGPESMVLSVRSTKLLRCFVRLDLKSSMHAHLGRGHACPLAVKEISLSRPGARAGADDAGCEQAARRGPPGAGWGLALGSVRCKWRASSTGGQRIPVALSLGDLVITADGARGGRDRALRPAITRAGLYRRRTSRSPADRDFMCEAARDRCRPAARRRSTIRTQSGCGSAG